MKTPRPFKMVHVHSEGEVLYVGWLPSDELLVGIDHGWNGGLCAVIGVEDARILNDALRMRDTVTLNEELLRVTRTNRGEPYRTGVEICLGGWEIGSAEIFVEETYIGDICDVIEKGLPALSADMTGP